MYIYMRRASKDNSGTKTLGIKVIVEMWFIDSKALPFEKYIYFLKQLQESSPHIAKTLCRIMFCTVLLERRWNGNSKFNSEVCLLETGKKENELNQMCHRIVIGKSGIKNTKRTCDLNIRVERNFLTVKSVMM